MKEQGIQNQILIAMSQHGAYGLRVNSGTFWGGEIVSHDGKLLLLKNPTKIMGAPAGTTDIIGCRPLFITPQMMGKTIAQFTVIEVKKPGENPKRHQENYMAQMRARGAIAGVCRSPEDMVRLLGV